MMRSVRTHTPNLRAARAVLLPAVLFVFVACRGEGEDPMLSRLRRTEPDPATGPTSERIEELESDVERYREEVEQRFRATRNLVSAHRMLGMRYLEAGMDGQALEQFRKAIDLQPDNSTLYYYAGVAAGRYAGAALEEEIREERLEMAERAYSRALELRPNYTSASYGLAILYAYELERFEEARKHIDVVLDAWPADDRAFAVSAYVYAGLHRIDEAIREYDRVIEHTTSESFRREARELQRRLREER